MAIIKPFNGIYYNPEMIPDLTQVTTPPYDVISEQEQKAFHELHPNNIIRLVLGEVRDNDDANNNPHTRAADYLKSWRDEQILKTDPVPAIYLTAIEFPFNGGTITRYGFISLVRLSRFEDGVILPHERTFSKVKSERLDLMKKTHANLCPIFSLFSDNGDILKLLREQAENHTPDFEFPDSAGHMQKLWRITDPEVQEFIQERMAEKTLFIADGHHRYETALNYREWIQNGTPLGETEHPSNYVMMYLAAMEDPGLIILPAHRLIKGIPESVLSGFPQLLEKYFHVQEIPVDGKRIGDAVEKMEGLLEEGNTRHTIGVSFRKQDNLLVLTLKSGVMEDLFRDSIPEALLDIDVTVLTRLVFMTILGFTHERLDNHELIGYRTSVSDAVEAVRKENWDAAFILNPTRIDQVRKIAEQGLTMPRKATFFYPKVLTGQVINSLSI